MRYWTSILLVWLTSQTLATTYYVKPYGDDSDSGLSPANAWEHVVRGLNAVEAGDTLFIMAGRYTGEGLNVGISVAHSGTPGNPIVIKGYRAIPILDGEFRMNGDEFYGYIIRCRRKSYVVFDSIDARNSGSPYNPANEAGCFYAVESDHITWKDCRACSSTGNVYKMGTNLSGGFMIKDSQHNLVKRCESWAHKTWTGSGWGTSMHASGVNIFRGTSDEHSVHNLVDSCHVYDCGGGILIGKSLNQKANVAQYNTVHDCSRGIGFAADSCVAKFNLLYDIYERGISAGASYGSVYHDSVYNNTVICKSNTGSYNFSAYSDIYDRQADYITVFNNIFVCHNGKGYGKENYMVRYDGYQPNDWYSDYNCFYDRYTSSEIVYYYDELSLSEWQNMTGCDSHSINQDPLFVDEASHDYRLAPGSPCIGTGRNGADMGAYHMENGKTQRSDIDRIIREHKEGTATEQQVKTYIQRYWQGE